MCFLTSVSKNRKLDSDTLGGCWVTGTDCLGLMGLKVFNVLTSFKHLICVSKIFRFRTYFFGIHWEAICFHLHSGVSLRKQNIFLPLSHCLGPKVAKCLLIIFSWVSAHKILPDLRSTGKLPISYLEVEFIKVICCCANSLERNGPEKHRHTEGPIFQQLLTQRLGWTLICI